jgi:hypothetical protein
MVENIGPKGEKLHRLDELRQPLKTTWGYPSKEQEAKANECLTMAYEHDQECFWEVRYLNKEAGIAIFIAEGKNRLSSTRSVSGE